MTENIPLLTTVEASVHEGEAASESLATYFKRLPLEDLYIAKKRELAKTYFDSDWRLRLHQELAGNTWLPAGPPATDCSPDRLARQFVEG